MQPRSSLVPMVTALIIAIEDMIYHTGGARRWSRDFATDYAGGYIGFSSRGGSREGCRQRQRPQARNGKVTLRLRGLHFVVARWAPRWTGWTAGRANPSRGFARTKESSRDRLLL